MNSSFYLRRDRYGRQYYSRNLNSCAWTFTINSNLSSRTHSISSITTALRNATRKAFLNHNSKYVVKTKAGEGVYASHSLFPVDVLKESFESVGEVGHQLQRIHIHGKFEMMIQSNPSYPPSKTFVFLFFKDLQNEIKEELRRTAPEIPNPFISVKSFYSDLAQEFYANKEKMPYFKESPYRILLRKPTRRPTINFF